MADLAVLDVTTRLNDLKPAEVPDRAGGPFDRSLNSVLDAVLRGADELDNLVNVIIHGTLPKLGPVRALQPGQARW